MMGSHTSGSLLPLHSQVWWGQWRSVIVAGNSFHRTDMIPSVKSMICGDVTFCAQRNFLSGMTSHGLSYLDWYVVSSLQL